MHIFLVVNIDNDFVDETTDQHGNLSTRNLFPETITQSQVQYLFGLVNGMDTEPSRSILNSCSFPVIFFFFLIRHIFIQIYQSLTDS